MTPSDWFSGFASVGAFGALMLSFFKGARLQGADSQRLGALEGRLNELEADVKHVVATVAEVFVVKEKVIGLDRLMTRELDEIKHTLRRLEERSFDPAQPARTRQPS